MGDFPTEQAGWTGLVRRIAKASGRRQDAEDLLHAAFLRLDAYERKAEVRSLQAFLIRAASNLARDGDRQRRMRAECPMDAAPLQALSDDCPLQHEAFEARERLDRVMAALDTLGPKTRDIFLMHRLDGLKYREIAAQRGITVSAVEKHIAKAVLFLTDWEDA